MSIAENGGQFFWAAHESPAFHATGAFKKKLSTRYACTTKKQRAYYNREVGSAARTPKHGKLGAGVARLCSRG